MPFSFRESSLRRLRFRFSVGLLAPEDPPPVVSFGVGEGVLKSELFVNFDCLVGVPSLVSFGVVVAFDAAASVVFISDPSVGDCPVGCGIASSSDGMVVRRRDGMGRRRGDVRITASML